MTKENFTSINVIIDQSGSMSRLASDTIGNFNNFLAEQKIVPGEATFTLCTFNSESRLVHDFVSLGSVTELTDREYRPSGNTALLDAVGSTIKSVGEKLAAMPEEERPSKVIFLIITDGHENASRSFSRGQVKAMIDHQTTKYNWEFVFMGANIDATAEGASLGISQNNTLNYAASPAGTKSLYSNVSDSLRTYRGGNSSKSDFFNKGSK